MGDVALAYQLLDRGGFLQFLDLTESSAPPTPRRSGCSATAWPRPICDLRVAWTWPANDAICNTLQNGELQLRAEELSEESRPRPDARTNELWSETKN